MAELTGVQYSRIMLVAIFPAVMYFFSVYMMVHWEAKMYNVVGERYPESATTILKREWLYTTPLIIITIFMLTGFSPGYSAILGLATCVAISHKTLDTYLLPFLPPSPFSSFLPLQSPLFPSFSPFLHVIFLLFFLPYKSSSVSSSSFLILFNP